MCEASCSAAIVAWVIATSPSPSTISVKSP